MGASATHFNLVPAWSEEGGACLLAPLSQARHLETCGTQCPTWPQHLGEWSSRNAPRASCISFLPECGLLVPTKLRMVTFMLDQQGMCTQGPSFPHKELFEPPDSLGA